ncbi:homeobox protein dve-1 isoform X2 [Uranotaenia lowii]|uniref:homeobox protein dve-1 isoform X2 n=1 Tax=Uranotaenia lowii TaxID=190385 RepID=UPI0024793713|nr:homeobox protein dve-1 isoform X2 [Uranotaenia lowii]
MPPDMEEEVIECSPEQVVEQKSDRDEVEQKHESEAEEVTAHTRPPSCEAPNAEIIQAKSLPLHCVVESVSSLQATLNFDARSPWKRRPNIETDSYVIIPAATPFCEIVTTALQRLGYSSEVCNAARGAISIKNWKTLALDAISDNPLVSVNDILGELTSVVTLKITILRNKPSQLAEIKDKLLKLLILQSHAVLRSTGCPLDEITLSQICRSSLQNTFPFGPEITEEVRRKFDQWWSNQLAPQPNPIAHKILPFANAPTSELDFPSFNNREALLENRPNPHHNLVVHPALQTVHSQYPNQKTRMRTSFDPEMELPKLQRWFQENPHPSRQQIQSYVVQLNSLDSRRGRKPLDVNNVVYWFKNARAAQKRAEMRQGMTNGFGNPNMMLPPPDYMKSSPSAPSEDIDNLSQDEMDDELDRPLSPQLPLSLTIHERNRPVTPNDDTPIKMENNSGANSPPPSPTPTSDLNTSNNNINESVNDSMNQNDAPKSIYSNERSASPQRSRSPASEDLDMDDPDESNMDDYRSPSPDSKRNLPFPITNPMFSHSIMYMSHYIPAMQANAAGMHLKNELSPNNHSGLGGAGGLNLSFNSSDERRKRNRTFIDPVTEVPKLEQWFSMNTHPSHNLILKYTEDLNRMPYRQKFPPLESKNVQFWFKNRRAKCKRLKMSLYDPAQLASLAGVGGDQSHLAASLHESQAHLAQAQMHQFHHAAAAAAAGVGGPGMVGGGGSTGAGLDRD